MTYTDEDLLFDMRYLEAEENEKLKDDNSDLENENDDLKEENEKLKAQLKEREDLLESDVDYDIDEAIFFAEDFQSIAADNWKEMEITNEEAWRAINLWFTPEEYYEYKTNSLS